jgi:hypothetical protein
MAQLSSNVLPYVGRTVDMLAFDDAKETGEAELTQTLVKKNQSGAVIAGIEKLVQRFLIELLTEQGSLNYLPNRGTVFITQARAGILQTSQDLFAAFSAAQVQVSINLTNEDSINNDPTDEQYQSATLLAVSLVDGNASLTIQVTSVAGTSRKVIYPLRIAVT